jgi:sulfhydrogenase subunit alpha
MSTTIRIEHLARVEGHGGVTVEMEDGADQCVRFDVFEGARLVEGLVRGRSFEDVSQILSRICAICSVAHALTSIKATERAFGVEV